MMKGLLADIVHAFRVYRRTPISSAASVVVLAIAMAFVAAFFSLYVDLLVRPHPGFEPGGRLITFGWNTGQNAGGLRYELIERIANESTTIEAAAGVSFGSVEIGQDREQVIGEMVTRHFFSGVRPRIALGHGLDESAHEPGSEPVAVISHDLWLQRFGGSPDVLGQTIEVVNRALPTTTRVENGQMVRNEPSAIDYRIVGVMSPHFTGITPLEQSQIAIWRGAGSVRAAGRRALRCPGRARVQCRRASRHGASPAAVHRRQHPACGCCCSEHQPVPARESPRPEA